MNFQQLRIIRETVRCNFNLTEAANRLFTSQSGVSKHIKDLEDELGVELFERKGKRLLGMGVGIVAEMAFNAERDLNLRRLDCSHLFPANLTKIAVREGHLQRHFADHFIALCTQAVPAASGI